MSEDGFEDLTEISVPTGEPHLTRISESTSETGPTSPTAHESVPTTNASNYGKNLREPALSAEKDNSGSNPNLAEASSNKNQPASIQDLSSLASTENTTQKAPTSASTPPTPSFSSSSGVQFGSENPESVTISSPITESSA